MLYKYEPKLYLFGNFVYETWRWYALKLLQKQIRICLRYASENFPIILDTYGTYNKETVVIGILDVFFF